MRFLSLNRRHSHALGRAPPLHDALVRALRLTGRGFARSSFSPFLAILARSSFARSSFARSQVARS